MTAIGKNYAKQCVKGKNFFTVTKSKQDDVRQWLESGELYTSGEYAFVVFTILEDGTVVPAEVEEETEE